jgi:serine protease Do
MQSPSCRVRLVTAALLLAASAAGCKSQSKPDALPPGAVPVTGATAGLVSSAIHPEPKAPADAKMAPLSFAPIAKKADPSVVTITTTETVTGGGGLFARHRAAVQKGLGTGFIVDKTGVIITNNHVVDGADGIVVQLSDERRFPGKVAGRDPRTDIAVVRIEGAKDLTAIPLGDSDKLEVGDWVVAIGNPFGLSHTVSAGIVSAKGRGNHDVGLDPSGYYNFLQTDASINPGNSGGPLLNLDGAVVGMNTAIRGDAQGIGFAIPINMVKQIVPTLLAEGHFTRSALGVRIRDLRDLSDQEKAEIKASGDKGAVVEVVEPGGPSEKAKLQPGDVIIGFDGKEIDHGTLLQWLASTAGVGKTVTVRVSRAGKTFELPVTLGELKEPRRTALQPQRRGLPDDFFGR